MQMIIFAWWNPDFGLGEFEGSKSMSERRRKMRENEGGKEKM